MSRAQLVYMYYGILQYFYFPPGEFTFFFVMYPFNLFKIHSHEVSFVFGSAGSCRGVYTHSDCDYGPSKVMPYMYLWVKSTVGLRQGF